MGIMNFRKEVFGRLPAKVVLAADVGGTTTKIGLCSVVGKKVRLCMKYTFQSQEIKNFSDVVETVVKDAGVKPWRTCIAAPGAECGLSDQKSCKLTNLKWRVDTKTLPGKAMLMNDFEALGYAVNILQPKDVKSVRTAKVKPKLPIALLGAGTGLGKSVLWFDAKKKIYVPHPSEGGHGDLPVKTSDEFILSKGEFEWEDVLSGQGIVRIYQFLRTIHTAPNLTDPSIIMAQNTQCARMTKAMFTSFYARCAKNFALDVMSRGGVFIGGGIAAKNPGLFGSAFTKEFVDSSQSAVLKSMPVKVITNKNMGLLGTAFAGVFA